MEYIIENIMEEEWDILEENGIDWCPDDVWTEGFSNIVIFDETEYNRAMELLGRN